MPDSRERSPFAKAVAASDRNTERLEREVAALRERLREAEEERDSLERGGEKLAVQVRGYLAEAIEDDPDHPATRSPLAQGLKAWNEARNSLRPTRNEEAREVKDA
jgi:hypothetical protein